VTDGLGAAAVNRPSGDDGCNLGDTAGNQRFFGALLRMHADKLPAAGLGVRILVASQSGQPVWVDEICATPDCGPGGLTDPPTATISALPQVFRRANGNIKIATYRAEGQRLRSRGPPPHQQLEETK
jgi:hypothetical protein